MNQQYIEPAPQLGPCPKRMGLQALLVRGVRRRQRSGQALTEFAMVVPLLLLIIYAMIIFALAIHTQIDFGNAVSTAVRKATVLGNGSTLPPAMVNTGATVPNPNLEDVDALIGQSMTQNLRSDDKGSIDSFDIQLEQSRIMPDALNNPDNTGTPQNIYKNTYCAMPAPASAPAACKAAVALAGAPYGSGTPTFDQNAWDYMQATTGVTDPCAYYYEAHQVQIFSSNTAHTQSTIAMSTYLDANERILLYQQVDTYTISPLASLSSVPTFPMPDSRYPTATANANLKAGCGRVYYVETRPTADQFPPIVSTVHGYSVMWDCTYAYTGQSYLQFPLGTPPVPVGTVGHTCYYYQNERNIGVASGSPFPLPDLVEVGLNYHYDPIPTEISSKTPLGNGFSLREHARGRLEPSPIPGG